ncbi:LysE family translocator [Streptoalloteichus hindustanus]|uniref:Threonine/homoserine/homoserine lactone efflux protein n=1 Tax=Streptoalloteichus hindustanus TaxID=2017 RepID=A0A1M5DN85_STRHI|nr:LysE family translocator [Streptoalloteichus hindustanus]SHF68469.1 Threonine/homoserine/homoserine lactone efflux protein [Streptoalloteichus hindustanus]
MPVSSVLAFWGVAALLIAVPGPDWAFAVSAGLRGHVVPAAGGIVLGYTAVTAVVAAGVGVLIASTPVALTALTLAGGLYLVWLGFAVLRSPAEPLGASPAPAGRRPATLARGMAVSGLNPKGLLIFVALLPQFTDPGASWPLPVQMAVLGMAFTVTCGVVCLGVAGFAHRLLRARPAASRVVSRVSGAAMVVVGVVLLAERLST